MIRLSTVISQRLVVILLLLGVVAVGLSYQDSLITNGRQLKEYLFTAYQRVEVAVAPCRRPLTYQLGAFDKRFGISESAFLKDVAAAAEIWETPIHKDLFALSSTGGLTINLVYDYRQAATDRLKKLGYALDNTKESYDALKTKYNALQAQYDKQQKTLDAKKASYQARFKAYEAEVTAINERGGATAEEADRLNREKDALTSLVDEINQIVNQVNQTADDLNALAQVLNRLAAALNINAANFNSVSSARGREFEEGLYTSGATGTSIDIYEFNDQAQLVRLLAHELGHALGLEHLDNPKAIMYRLNQATNDKLTPDDLAALKTLCGIK